MVPIHNFIVLYKQCFKSSTLNEVILRELHKSCDLSVLIPVNNEEQNIDMLMTEIHKFDDCKYQIEVIISDNFSEDTTLKLVNEKIKGLKNIKVISNNHYDKSLSRNFLNLVSSSTGKYYTFLGACDKINIDVLLKSLDFMLNNQKFSLMVSDMVIYNNLDRIRKIQYYNGVLVASDSNSKLEIMSNSSLSCLGGWIARKSSSIAGIDEQYTSKFPMNIVALDLFYTGEFIYMPVHFYTKHYAFDENRETDSIYTDISWIDNDLKIAEKMLDKDDFFIYKQNMNNALRDNLIQFKTFGGNTILFSLLKQYPIFLRSRYFQVLIITLIPKVVIRIFLKKYRNSQYKSN